jgi:hypothetical protein
VSFLVKLFTIKGNLVFMNNLYHKVAVVSVCTALGFALRANKEAEAATFTLTATEFFVEDIYTPNGYGTDGLGDRLLNSRYDNEFIPNEEDYPSIVRFPSVGKILNRERRAFYEFNIGNLSLAPNTVISSAIFQASVPGAEPLSFPWLFLYLDIFGYVGNGRPDLSDFGAGVWLGRENTLIPFPDTIPKDIVNFDVTGFVNERVSNRAPFAGFGIRVQDLGNKDSRSGIFNYGKATLGGTTNYTPSLIIETVDAAEPVPEPTTIFGSAIGLCLGGWLKRKKSSPQYKTTPQD